MTALTFAACKSTFCPRISVELLNRLDEHVCGCDEIIITVSKSIGMAG